MGDMPAFSRRKLCRGRRGEAGVARLLPEYHGEGASEEPSFPRIRPNTVS